MSKETKGAADFSHLEKMKVTKGSKALYAFDFIEGTPTLIVRPATEQNESYLNAVLRTGKKMLRRMRGGKMSVAMLRESREQDLGLYPKHIVDGWTVPPVDVKGNPVKYNAENCEAFLRAVPVDMFDDMRTYCGDPDNFREEDELTSEEVETLTGN